MNKIKVLQFPIRSTNGGISHYAMQNWSFINKDRFSFDFCAVKNRVPIEKDIIESGAGMKYISCYAEEDEKQFIKEFRDIFRKNNYDAIHLHTSFWKSFVVEKIALDCGIPKIIVHSHSTNIDINDIYKRKKAEEIHNRKKKEFNTSLATDFCACSWKAADWLFGNQIPRDRIKILKNAININRFIFDNEIRNKYRRELGLDNCFVVGHVGRLQYPKNQDFLIDVFVEISKKVSNARLLLVGEGGLETDLKSKVSLLGLNDKVTFTGFRNDVNCLLQAMDVFCLPSRFEGLPIVLIEAQSAGLKCFASNVITPEICLTNNIELLDLDIESWSERLIEISKGYERNNMYDEITEAGYNIVEQVKVIERLYSS